MPVTRKAVEPIGGPRSGVLTDDLRRLLRRELLKDSCSATAIARLFSMHRRTLHRHLRTEGRAFRQLINEVRFEIARELLQNTGLAVSQIAAALQYSEPSAFTRAFRRWSGQTPSAWRANGRDVGASQRHSGTYRPLGDPSPGAR